MYFYFIYQFVIKSKYINNYLSICKNLIKLIIIYRFVIKSKLINNYLSTIYDNFLF